MGQRRCDPLKIVDLPVELLTRIFCHLDEYDLVRASQICNHFRQVIDSSEELLYAIDLKYFHSIPVPLPGSELPVVACRKLLRRSETAWQIAKYSKRYHIPVPHGNIQRSNGVLGVATPEQLHFVQLPLSGDVTDPTNWRQWSYEVDSENLVVFGFSSAQDLLVILSMVSVREGTGHQYEVSFRSLSEDKVHPDAASAVLKVLDTQVNPVIIPSSYVRAIIFGDYFGLLCGGVRSLVSGIADILQIFDWKSKDGYRCSEFFGNGVWPMDFSFLSNDRILVVTTSGQLLLYSMVLGANVIQLVAKFSLPTRLCTGLERVEFSHVPDPAYPFTPSLCSSRFQASTQNQLIGITMNLEKPLDSAWTHRSSYCIQIYVERNTLLELEYTYTSHYGKADQDSPALPWSTWGPGRTQFFLANPNPNDDRNHCSYGFRTAELIGETFSFQGELQPRQLCIRDFNPHRVMHYKAGNGIRWHERLVEGEPPSPDIQCHFLDEIGTGLPYLEIITQEKFLASEIIMDENRVLLSLPHVQDIEVLDFT